MSTRARLISLCGLFLVACSNPEAAHLKGLTGSAGSGVGAAGATGAAGVGAAGATGVAALGLAGATGLAGDQGPAGATGAAGDQTGAAGVGAAGAGTAGVGAAGAGVAGAGVAGAGAAGAGVAGAGVAGAGVAGAGAAGAGAAGAGVAGAGAAGAGAAGATQPGEYSNWCSPVHWAFMYPTAINAMDFAANVADGNIASRWATGANQAPGQYFQIDFGGTVSLTQVVLDASNNTGDYPRGLTVAMSADGTNFGTALATLTPTTFVVTATFAATQGRYLRLSQTATANLWWSIDEIRVMCTVPGNNTGLIDPFVPQYWSATASRSGGGDTPDKAIDADHTTRWSTGGAMMQNDFFQVDLGGPAMISGITYDFGGAADFPIAYKVEVSTNNTTFTQAAMGAGAGGINKIVFAAKQNARYVKITQTAVPPAGANYWSIYYVSVQP